MTDEQLKLLKFAKDYYLLTAPQFARLTGRSVRAIRKAVSPLLQRRMLQVKHRLVKSQFSIYGLGREGAKVVGGESPRLEQRSDYFLDHDLLITDVHIELKDWLVDWQQGKHLWKTVTPDAYFILERSGRQRAFFLEADRATMDVPDIQKKYRRYWEYFQAGQHTQLGIRTFSVLLVALDIDHAKKLARAVEGVIPKDYRKLYLFSSMPIEPCCVPHDEQRYTLMLD